MVFDIGVEDARRHALFSRCLHACVVARRIFRARDDLQQIGRSTDNDAKDEGCGPASGDPRNIFELAYSESLAQTASHCLALFLRNHESPPREWNRCSDMLLPQPRAEGNPQQRSQTEKWCFVMSILAERGYGNLVLFSMI